MKLESVMLGEIREIRKDDCCACLGAYNRSVQFIEKTLNKGHWRARQVMGISANGHSFSLDDEKFCK